MNKKAAYIISQAACALIELEAMKAANSERQQRGESDAYGEKAFMELQNKYVISHNAVLSYLYNHT